MNQIPVQEPHGHLVTTVFQSAIAEVVEKTSSHDSFKKLWKTRLGKRRLGKTRLGKRRLGKMRLGKRRLGKTRLGKRRLGKARLGKRRWWVVLLSLVAVLVEKG